MKVQELIEALSRLPIEEGRSIFEDMRKDYHDTDPNRVDPLADLPPNLRAIYDRWAADPANDPDNDWTWDDILEYDNASRSEAIIVEVPS